MNTTCGVEVLSLEDIVQEVALTIWVWSPHCGLETLVVAVYSYINVTLIILLVLLHDLPRVSWCLYSLLLHGLISKARLCLSCTWCWKIKRTLLMNITLIVVSSFHHFSVCMRLCSNLAEFFHDPSASLQHLHQDVIQRSANVCSQHLRFYESCPSNHQSRRLDASSTCNCFDARCPLCTNTYFIDNGDDSSDFSSMANRKQRLDSCVYHSRSYYVVVILSGLQLIGCTQQGWRVRTGVEVNNIHHHWSMLVERTTWECIGMTRVRGQQPP